MLIYTFWGELTLNGQRFVSTAPSLPGSQVKCKGGAGWGHETNCGFSDFGGRLIQGLVLAKKVGQKAGKLGDFTGNTWEFRRTTKFCFCGLSDGFFFPFKTGEMSPEGSFSWTTLVGRFHLKHGEMVMRIAWRGTNRCTFRNPKILSLTEPSKVELNHKKRWYSGDIS